ncbi:MAG: hypothetical protein LBP86_04165 [Azoarcus sp.]|nr:hypothetical protein [Azoarcus sp.]
MKAIDKEDLLRIVEPWNPLEQRTAVASPVHYARHIEKTRHGPIASALS